jgi:hypothetical protein
MHSQETDEMQYLYEGFEYASISLRSICRARVRLEQERVKYQLVQKVVSALHR